MFNTEYDRNPFERQATDDERRAEAAELGGLAGRPAQRPVNRAHCYICGTDRRECNDFTLATHNDNGFRCPGSRRTSQLTRRAVDVRDVDGTPITVGTRVLVLNMNVPAVVTGIEHDTDLFDPEWAVITLDLVEETPNGAVSTGRKVTRRSAGVRVTVSIHAEWGRRQHLWQHLDPSVRRVVLDHAHEQALEIDAQHYPAPEVKRQCCRKCQRSMVPAVTLTFDGGARRLHWCADHADDAEQYRASADGTETPTERPEDNVPEIIVFRHGDSTNASLVTVTEIHPDHLVVLMPEGVERGLSLSAVARRIPLAEPTIAAGTRTVICGVNRCAAHGCWYRGDHLVEVRNIRLRLCPVHLGEACADDPDFRLFD